MHAPHTGTERLRVALIGLGPWGRNLLRTFGQTPRCDVVAVCDQAPDRLEAAPADAARREAHVGRVFEASDVDAVILATPATTHASLAMAALDAGKHVFVEKPMALGVHDAASVVSLAEARRRRLMVGHVLEHHPGVLALSTLIAEDRLGQIDRILSFRFGPSPPREEGSWWSLAPHDVSLARRFSMREATSVMARRRVTDGGEVISARLQFGAVTADIQVGSGHRTKVRRTVVLGSRGAAELDDCRATDKLRLVDARDPGFESFTGGAGIGRVIPIPDDEPLACEALAFVRGVLEDAPFFGDGPSALQVTATLAAGDLSLSLGRAVAVSAEPEPLPTFAAAAP